MTSMSQKTTRVAEAIANLVDQFKSKDDFESFLTAFVQQTQEIENAAFQILLLTTLSSAFGAQLDGIGEIVGVEREGRNDVVYRLRIGAQILLNSASGSAEELLQLCVAMGATSAELLETYPAKIEITSNSPVTDGSEIGQIIELARAAAVGQWFTYFEGTNPFRFDTAGQGLDQGELAGVTSSWSP